MFWYTLGQQTALRQLGMHKVALTRPPTLARDAEDRDLSPSVRKALLEDHIENMRGHHMDSPEDYVQDAHEGGLLGGGIAGAALGGGIGMALGRGRPWQRMGLGASAGGLIGAGLGYATGGLRGRSQHRTDEAERSRVLGLGDTPHGLERELAAQLRNGTARSTEEQRQHERALAHLHQQRFNYNVNSNYGSPRYYY